MLASAYAHLSKWVARGIPPATAPPLLCNADGAKTREAPGLAQGGIRVSRVAAPTAVKDGDNPGESFCRLFGARIPFEQPIYRSKVIYLAAVVKADTSDIRKGYLKDATR